MFPGSDECPFPHPLNDSKDWSPESPDTSCSRPQRIHSCTQTEAPQPPPAASDITDPQPALLPAAPPLPSCPSPVRKERHCAKWENREEDSKPTYECLESVSVAAARPSPLPPHTQSKMHRSFRSPVSCCRTTTGWSKQTRHYAWSWGRQSGRWTCWRRCWRGTPCTLWRRTPLDRRTLHIWKAGAAPLWQDL